MKPRGCAVHVVFSICICAFLFSCRDKSQSKGLEQNVEPLSPNKGIVHLINVGNIGTDDFNDLDSYFAQITAIRIDRQNNIYVLDSRDFNLKIFALTGAPVRTIVLKRGQGPGEFLRPKCFAVDDNCLFIADMNKMTVVALDMFGNFLNSIPIDFQPADIEVDSGKLFVTGFFDYSENRVHVYDKKSGKKQKAFAEGTPLTKEVAEFGERDSIFTMNGFLYFSSFFPYDVRVYSFEGKLINSFLRKDSRFGQRLNKNQVTGALDFVIGIAEILAMTDGTVISIVKTRDLDKNTLSSHLDIFNRHGRWLTSVPASEFNENTIRVADMNQHGYLVIDSIEPYPRVRIFSLEITR